jgi:hypothetical protein
MSELPIVTFGKYKDKPVTELLADDKYVEWLKQQSWFTNQKPIYNIVVNQQINQPNLNSKTPEHNSLQNKFLDENNRIKLLKKLSNKHQLKEYEKLKLLLNNENFIKNFGNYDVNKLFHPKYNCQYEFEGKYNWDLIVKYINIIYYDCKFIIDINNELCEKDKFKKEYDLRMELKLNELKENQKEDNLIIELKLNEFEKIKKELNLKMDLNLKLKLNNLEQEKEQILSNNAYKIERFYKYYDENFNEEYKKYRIEKLKEIFSSIEYINITYENNEINVKLSSGFNLEILYCEIKPLLSDDYPNVLRKMKTQISLQKEFNRKIGYNYDKYILIIKEFASNTVTKKQLITIFNNSDIHVIFTDEIFDDEINNNILTIKNSDSKLVDDLKSELEKQKLLINELMIENENLKKILKN